MNSVLPRLKGKCAACLLDRHRLAQDDVAHRSSCTTRQLCLRCMSRGHFAKHCTLDERVVQRCIGCLLPAMPDPEDPTGKRDLFHGASPWSHSCPNSVVRAVLFYARGAGHLQIVPPPQQPQELSPTSSTTRMTPLGSFCVLSVTSVNPLFITVFRRSVLHYSNSNLLNWALPPGHPAVAS